MLIVDKHCSDVCCDEFSVPQIDRKCKTVTWKILFAISMGKDSQFLHTENIKICGRVTKLETIKMQFFVFSSISAENLNF